MQADHPKVCSLLEEFGEYCPTRLQPWKFDPTQVDKLKVWSGQNRLAVPAKAQRL